MALQYLSLACLELDNASPRHAALGTADDDLVHCYGRLWFMVQRLLPIYVQTDENI
jgi:hypothetical protein